MKIVSMIKSAFGFVKAFSKTHQGELLIGCCIAGGIAAAVEGGRAAIKAHEAIKTEKERKVNEAKEANPETEVTVEEVKLKPSEVVRVVWKKFIPVVLILVLSTTCGIFSAKAYNKRYAALATAYSVAEGLAGELTIYKQQVEQMLGKEKAEEIAQAVMEQKKQQPPQQAIPYNQPIIVNTGYGTTICKDPWSGRLFYSSSNHIKGAISELNQRINSSLGNACTLNDYYELVGLEETEAGDHFVWRAGENLPVYKEDSEVINGDPILIAGFLYDPMPV